jgi:cell division protein FtsW
MKDFSFFVEKVTRSCGRVHERLSSRRSTSARPRGPDLWLGCSVLALTALGIVIVHSAGAIPTVRVDANGLPSDVFSFTFVERQALHAAIGVFAMLAAFFIDPRALMRRSGWLFLGTFALLAAMLIIPGLGHEAGGATRWVTLGPIRFQPSELAKLALLFFFARALMKWEDRLPSFRRGFVPLLLLAGLVVLPVLLQPDFGMAVTLAAVALAMMFGAGARIWHLAATVLASLPVAWWLIESTPYRARRMLAFLDFVARRRDEGYQVYESMVSFASGGWTGVGLGAGPQKLGRFPEYHNDFVFAAVGEELGFVGVAGVILLFAVVVWRGLRIAARVADRSLSVLAFGITALLGVQAACHMGVVMALLPTKGLPLPFVSYGGTSLIVSLFLVGVLLYISGEPERATARASAPARDDGAGGRFATFDPAHASSFSVGVADFAQKRRT